MTKLLTPWARRAFLSKLHDVRGGTLRLVCGDRTLVFGPKAGGGKRRTADQALDATLVVSDERFFRRAVADGDIGIGESYMDGDWAAPDLVALIRLMLRNLSVTSPGRNPLSVLRQRAAGLARRLRDNTTGASRRHVRRHYDLGNDFFSLFLDERLMYSSAVYGSPHDTLERAQEQKLDLICRKLELGPDDHVLEIGTGWGGFAHWAATRYGCRVTTTTLSGEQFAYARDCLAGLGGAGGRVEVLQQDYRELTGRYDKIVSIEMFEAVGVAHYDDYFGAVERLLAPDGAMLLQTITLDDQYFPSYQGQADWIEKYIFPGGELASISEILRSLARATRMSLYHAENFGTHYARTLHAWRERFHRRLDRVRALGFDDRFIRMWDLYLAYCEAAFLERHTGVFQLLLNRNYSTRRLFNEPWDNALTAAVA